LPETVRESGTTGIIALEAPLKGLIASCFVDCYLGAFHFGQVAQVDHRAKWLGRPPGFPLLLQSRYQGRHQDRQAQLAGGLGSWIAISDDRAADDTGKVENRLVMATGQGRFCI
jgi:hypothetical protein